MTKKEFENNRRAAEQGKAYAQYNWGVCYENGWGVPQDRVEAIRWLTNAAEKGEPNAIGALKKLQ